MQKDKLITANEARKLLGKKSKTLTNEELEDLMLRTETVVRIAIRQFIGSKNLKNDANIGLEEVSII